MQNSDNIGFNVLFSRPPTLERQIQTARRPFSRDILTIEVLLYCLVARRLKSDRLKWRVARFRDSVDFSRDVRVSKSIFRIQVALENVGSVTRYRPTRRGCSAENFPLIRNGNPAFSVDPLDILRVSFRPSN